MTTPTREKMVQAFNAYCKRNGIRANGQFAVEDGTPLFEAGYNAARADLEEQLAEQKQQLAECQATNEKLWDVLLPVDDYILGPTAWTAEKESTLIASLKEALALPNDATALNELIAERTASLTAEVERLVSAIDEHMVVSHIGVFNRGDDIKEALNKIACYEQGLGEYFGKELRQQNAELTAQRDEAMMDAERYQHLRENHFIWTTPVFLKDSDKVKSYVAIEFHWHTSKDKKPTKTSLDEAIDAAIANCK